MHFYYNPVSADIRKMCWNQGDWRFYKHYRAWQNSTYEMALGIIKNTPIDLVHQLNMIGFREPGYLWKIRHIPFVWGPIGGLKQFPPDYLEGAGSKIKVFNRLKNFINVFQLKYDSRVNSALKQASLVISSIPDSYEAIKRVKGLESIIISETGCYTNSQTEFEKKPGTSFELIWVGKFDFRKQLPLAIKALAATRNKVIRLNVFGKGNEAQELEVRRLTNELDISNQVFWHGSQPHDQVLRAMRSADLFFFTSVSEDTSTVVLEAIGNNLPVLCFDACGFGPVVNEEVGIKIPLSNPGQSVLEFAEKLNFLEGNRQLLNLFSKNCNQRQELLSWENKARTMLLLYEGVLENEMEYGRHKH
jgi:glycosyltransferase involved in cell wall biosynthesis